MAIITAEQVHSREWMKCPMCQGKPLTETEIKKGYQCGTCYNKGEIPRHGRRAA